MPYLTPQTNPTDVICRVLLIPNDPLFIANVTGALEELTFGYNWEAFGAVTVEDAKNAMLAMFNSYCFGEVGDCLSTPQFRQNDNCLLQVSQDGGTTWDTVFDASSCVDALVQSGRYGQFGPTAPVTTPLPAFCDTRRVTVYANTPYQSPFLLNTGDTVNITIIKDGPWAGTLNAFADTHCADGAFLDSFAQCGGSADPGHSGDPLPSASHMRIVMEIGGVWYDAYNASFTVPGATTDAVLTIQANDDVLLDNTGYTIFDIEVCTQGTCENQDFTASMGSWTFPASDDGCGHSLTYGTQDGSGLHSVTNACASAEWLHPVRDFGVDVTMIRLRFHLALDGDPYAAGSGSQNVNLAFFDSGGSALLVIALPNGFTSGDFLWTGNLANVRKIHLFAGTFTSGWSVNSGHSTVTNVSACWI